MSEETMVRTPKAAERLGLSVRKVKGMIASGELPSVKIGAARLIEESAIEGLIAARREGGTVDSEEEARA